MVYKVPVNPDSTLGKDEVLINMEDFLHEIEGLVLLDGKTADLCGSAYVTVMSGAILRISPDGESEVLVNMVALEETGMSVLAIHLGPGYGGWKSDHQVFNRGREGMYIVHEGACPRDGDILDILIFHDTLLSIDLEGSHHG